MCFTPSCPDTLNRRADLWSRGGHAWTFSGYGHVNSFIAIREVTNCVMRGSCIPNMQLAKQRLWRKCVKRSSGNCRRSQSQNVFDFSFPNNSNLWQKNFIDNLIGRHEFQQCLQILSYRAYTGRSDTMAMSSTNGLVGIGFASRYRQQYRVGF